MRKTAQSPWKTSWYLLYLLLSTFWGQKWSLRYSWGCLIEHYTKPTHDQTVSQTFLDQSSSTNGTPVSQVCRDLLDTGDQTTHHRNCRGLKIPYSHTLFFSPHFFNYEMEPGVSALIPCHGAPENTAGTLCKQGHRFLLITINKENFRPHSLSFQ